jgi:hypothetical protein
MIAREGGESRTGDFGNFARQAGGGVLAIKFADSVFDRNGRASRDRAILKHMYIIT